MDLFVLLEIDSGNSNVSENQKPKKVTKLRKRKLLDVRQAFEYIIFSGFSGVSGDHIYVYVCDHVRQYNMLVRVRIFI